MITPKIGQIVAILVENILSLFLNHTFDNFAGIFINNGKANAIKIYPAIKNYGLMKINVRTQRPIS
jgi:hypothetical protein